MKIPVDQLQDFITKKDAIRWRLRLPINDNRCEKITIDFIDATGNLEEKCENRCYTLDTHFMSNIISGFFKRYRFFEFGLTGLTKGSFYFNKPRDLLNDCLLSLENVYLNYTPVYFEHDVRKGKDPIELIESFELPSRHLECYNKIMAQMEQRSHCYVWMDNAKVLLLQLNRIHGTFDLENIRREDPIEFYFVAKFIKELSNVKFDKIVNSVYFS